MEILVCTKQVPDDSVEIRLDEASGKPATEGVEPIVNAFDTYALEMAAQFLETGSKARSQSQLSETKSRRMA